MAAARRTHWDQVYRTKADTEVSWYEAHPESSLRLVRATGLGTAVPIRAAAVIASILGQARGNRDG